MALLSPTSGRAGCGWMRRGALAPIAAAFLLWSIAAAAAAESAASKEYQIKAAFLFKFARFVEWPPSSFAQSDSPLCIGILGEDPFGSTLDDMLRGEEVRGRPLITRRSGQVEDLTGCHIVYISSSEAPRIGTILTKLSSEPVLTVSDIDGFADRGGCIRLGVDGNKIRFDINPPVLQQHRLKAVAQLLSLGKVVTTDPAADRR
jgi:hypothetical protein